MTTFFIDCVIKVSIVFLAGLALLPLLRKQSASVRHWVLSTALLCAALMPVFNLALPALEIRIPARQEKPISPPDQILLVSDWVELDASLPVSPGTRSTPVAPPAPRLSQGQAVLILWATGAFAALVTLLCGVARLAWLGYESERVIGASWLRMAQSISTEYGLRRPPRLLRSRQPSILATWGFVRPAIVLPASSNEWSEDRIEIVLSHEFAHVRRRDWLIQILGSVVRSFYWFNPLAWMLCRRLEVECEQACDDAVLQRGFTPAHYATHLLELAKTMKGKPGDWTPALAMGRHSTLDRRFRALLEASPNRRRGSYASVATTLMAFLALSLPVAAIRASSFPAVPTTLPAPKPAVRVPAGGTTATAVATLVLQNAPLQPGMSSIAGTVVRADSDAPVAGATVELQLTTQHPPDTNSYQTVTDTIGRFTFPAVAPAEYRVVASTYQSGYVTMAYGRNSAYPRGAAIKVAAGQRVNDLKLAMVPTASLTGRVVDKDGEPVPRAQVLALRVSYREGRKGLDLVQAVPADDQGEYRLFWLPPGAYYISAKPERAESRSSTSFVILPGTENNFTAETDPTIVRRPLDGGGVAEEVFVPVYFPGVIDPRRAKPVELHPGEKLNGMQIDISPGRLPSFHVRGTVLDAATGRTAPNTQVNLVSPEAGAISFVPNAMTDANGRFDVAGVPPGQHYLVARLFLVNPNRAGAFNVDRNSFAAFLPLEVNGDVENLKLTVGLPISIAGRITIEGRAPDPNDADLARMRINFGQQPNRRGLMEVSNDPLRSFGAPINSGAAVSLNISPGRYGFGISGLAPTMYVKSFHLGSLDLLSGPVTLNSQPPGELDAVIGVDGGSLEGKVLNAKRDPVADALVVLIPDSSRRERTGLYKTVNADSSGNFQFQGIEPGRYKVFAWQDVEPGVWVDPDFMQPLENRGRAVDVSPKSRATTEVTVIP